MLESDGARRLNCPSFLPALVPVDGTWDSILARLYGFYCSEIMAPLYFRSARVITDNRILPDGDGKEEGFWHLITRRDKGKGNRLLDPRRAERLRWIRALVENHTHGDVLVFDHAETTPKKSIRTYIWLKEHDFVVVLQQSGRSYYLVTAFYINSEKYRKDLRRKFENAQK